VAAGRSEISLKLLRGPEGAVNAGVWSAATGQTVQYAGRETAERIALAATSPLALDGVKYEARIDVAASDPERFTLRQLMRAEGDAAWRLVAEMIYRPASG